jgi:hypothetical protein
MSDLRPIYCPECFNHSCVLKSKGKISIYFDGKQRTSGQFIYNLDEQRIDQLKTIMHEKLEDYFKWYSEFKNKKTIEKIDLISDDFFCENGCGTDGLGKFSVIGVLFSEKYFRSIVEDLANEYDIQLDL